MFRVIESYKIQSLGLPYPITLLHGAEEELDEDGHPVGVAIPDLEQLVAAVAIARALMPVQLAGSEVRFLRRALGMSAKALADALHLDTATLSRWETGKQAVGEWADKQVRMCAIIKLRDQVPGLSVDPTAIVGMPVVPRAGEGWPEITMQRVACAAPASPGCKSWDTRHAA